VNKEQLQSNWKYVENALLYYTTCYTHSWDAILELAQYSSKCTNKIFAFNFASRDSVTNCKDRIQQLMPFVDILFCNPREAQVFAETQGLRNKKDRYQISAEIASMEKVDKKRPRQVVITDKQFEICVAIQGEKKSYRFKYKPLEKSMIVDVSGSGDAFVGGYLSQILLENPIKTCVQYAVYASKEVMQLEGCGVPMKGPNINHVFESVQSKESIGQRSSSITTLPFEPSID